MEKYCTIGGKRIKYLDEGGGDCVILIHGLGGHSGRWEKVIPELSKGHRVIAPDLPGFGDSDKPAHGFDYSIPAFSEFINDFMKNLDIGKADIIGSSMGGYIAAYFASEHPEKAKNLVLVSPAGLSRRATPEAMSYMNAVYFPTEETAKSALEELFYDKNVVDEEMVVDFVDKMKNDDSKNAYFSSFFNLSRNHEFEEKLGKIKSPSLIIWGEEDEIIPCEYAEEYVSMIHNSKKEMMQKCGHMPFIEKPKEFLRLVKRHLDQ
ncbi:MAG: alpha/beta fold hydrolase [Candidatus Aenigmarchaeota archaeon]|nr:alpha/beta fold hydrolase [Candidatus Aenigmarchaeota archaeon]